MVSLYRLRLGPVRHRYESDSFHAFGRFYAAGRFGSTGKVKFGLHWWREAEMPAGYGQFCPIAQAAEVLGPLVLGLGTWGREWLKREITEEEADPALLMWDMQRSVHLDRLLQDRVVTLFRYRDAPEKKRAWWLIGEHSGTDLCLSDPGFGVDLHVDAEARAMAEVWIGRLDWGQRCARGESACAGPNTSCAACRSGWA